MNKKILLSIIVLLVLFFMLGGCSSMPLPEGWETENTKNRKLEIELLEKQLAEENAKPEPKGKCESIMAPIRGSSDIAIATYYTAMAGCTGGLGDPALMVESPAVQLSNDFEATRRENAKNKTALARIFTDGILGVARMGVDIEIAKDNRESNEKIAKYGHELALKELENPGKGAIWVTDGGVYTTNEGSNNPITEDNDVTTTTDNRDLSTVDSNDNYSQDNDQTTTTDNRDLSTVDSNDNYSQDNDQTTTTDNRDLSTVDSNDNYSQDNDQTTTTDNRDLSTVDSNDNYSQDNDQTTTTDSNDQTTTTTTTTYPIPESTEEEEEEEIDPILSIADNHANCVYNVYKSGYTGDEKDTRIVQCNVQYNNAERLEVYKKCDGNGWDRKSEDCVRDIQHRNVWAKKYGLRWNNKRQTYELIK